MQSIVRSIGFLTDDEISLVAQFRRLDDIGRQIIVSLTEKFAANGSDPLPENVIPFPR